MSSRTDETNRQLDAAWRAYYETPLESPRKAQLFAAYLEALAAFRVTL